MKDITSTSFGIFIAFLLPGLIFLLALGQFIAPVRELLIAFGASKSNVGLFLMVVLYSVALGLQVCALRWIIYEKWFCGEDKISSDLFKKLSDAGKLDAFRAAVDEHYRYHQFWGGVSLVFPLLFIGMMVKHIWPFFTSTWWEWIISIGIFLAVESITVFAAIDAYVKYSNRANNIMIGG